MKEQKRRKQILYHNCRGEYHSPEKDNAITLISLVISIIILLILAGVSLSAVIGENGILNQATNAAEQTAIAYETEAIETLIALEKIDRIQNPSVTSSYYIGTTLIDKKLENGNSWNIVVINDTLETYGTGWNFIEVGTDLIDYGESKYAWLVNYEIGEKVRLEEGEYIQLDYTKSVAVTDGLIFNIDPSILEGYSWSEIYNDTSILGDNVELVGFEEDSDESTSGLTLTSFNFDGVNDYIKIDFSNNIDELEKLYEQGLTFEFYGTIEIGSVKAFASTNAEPNSYARNIWTLERY